VDLKEQVKVVSAASKYADTAGKFLGAELRRPVTEQDIVTFASALSAIFGSWVYHQMHAGAGQGAADTFLNQIFTQLAASVQQRGTPVVLQISMKATPVESGAPADGKIVHEEERCACIIDQSGHCQSCEKLLGSMISNISGLAEEGASLRSKSSCRICFQALIDPVFAGALKSDRFKAMAPETRDVVIAMIVQSAQAMGTAQLPLIEKALEGLK
jgi:hypothetical protein